MRPHAEKSFLFSWLAGAWGGRIRTLVGACLLVACAQLAHGAGSILLYYTSNAADPWGYTLNNLSSILTNAGWTVTAVQTGATYYVPVETWTNYDQVWDFRFRNNNSGGCTNGSPDLNTYDSFGPEWRAKASAYMSSCGRVVILSENRGFQSRNQGNINYFSSLGLISGWEDCAWPFTDGNDVGPAGTNTATTLPGAPTFTHEYSGGVPFTVLAKGTSYAHISSGWTNVDGVDRSILTGWDPADLQPGLGSLLCNTGKLFTAWDMSGFLGPNWPGDTANLTNTYRAVRDLLGPKTCSCGSPSATPTATPSTTPSATRTPSPSASPTATSTATRTPTPSATASATATSSPSASPTPSASASATPTSSPSASPSWTPTATVSATRSATPSQSPTATDTATRSATPSASPSASATATPSPTVSVTFLDTLTDTATLTPTSSGTPTPSASPSASPTPSVTATRSATASSSPSPSDSPTQSPGPSPTDTATSSPSPSASPSFSPSATPSATPSASVTPSATPSATQTPSFSATASPSASPTASPTVSLSATPSATLTLSPSASATASPSPSPSGTVSPSATLSPTVTLSPTITLTPIPVPNRLVLNIYNAAGERVRQLFDGAVAFVDPGLALTSGSLIPGLSQVGVDLRGAYASGIGSLIWDGSNDGGQPVASGVYTVKAEFRQPDDRVVTVELPVSVLQAPLSQRLEVFNSAGERVYGVDLASGLLSGGFRLASASMVAGTATDGTPLGALKVYLEGISGELPWSWDGKGDNGAWVQSGTYILQLSQSWPDGRTQTLLKQFTVLRGPDDDLPGGTVLAGPSPLRSGDALELSFDPAPGLELLVWGYSLSGELVFRGQGQAASGRLRLDLGALASGVYLLETRFMDGSALRRRLSLKICVVH